MPNKPISAYADEARTHGRTVASSPDATLPPPAFGSAVYLPQQAPCDSHLCAPENAAEQK